MDTAWIRLTSCTWLHEASVLKSVLEAAEIEVFLPDEYSVGVQPGLAPAGGVRVMVRGEDELRAREVIESAALPVALGDAGPGDGEV